MKGINIGNLSVINDIDLFKANFIQYKSFNDFPEGIVFADQCSNSPYDDYASYFCITLSYGDEEGMQLAYDNYNNGGFYVRGKSQGTWRDWKSVELSNV